MSTAKNYEVQFLINGIVYEEKDLITLSTRKILYDKMPTIGNCIAGEINVKMYLPTTDVPRAAELRPYYRELGTTEWKPRGVYFVYTRTYDEKAGVLTLTGYDAVIKMEAEYVEATGTVFTPEVDCDAVKKICGVVGCEIESGTWNKIFKYVIDEAGNYNSKKFNSLDLKGRDKIYFTKTGNYTPKNSKYTYIFHENITYNLDYVYTTGTLGAKYTYNFTNLGYKYTIAFPGTGDGAYTMREVLGHIAGLYGGNFMMDNDGKLKLVVFGDIPKETHYLVEEYGSRILIGGVAILV